MWVIDLEKRIIDGGKNNHDEELQHIREELTERQAQVDYLLKRFMKEHGETFEKNDALTRAYEDIADQYATVQRLFRVLEAYE